MTRLAKKAYKSKTIWVNVLTLAIATLAFTADQPWLSKEALAGIIYMQGLANIVLRFLTNQAVDL